MTQGFLLEMLGLCHEKGDMSLLLREKHWRKLPTGETASSLEEEELNRGRTDQGLSMFTEQHLHCEAQVELSTAKTYVEPLHFC